MRTTAKACLEEITKLNNFKQRQILVYERLHTCMWWKVNDNSKALTFTSILLRDTVIYICSCEHEVISSTEL